MLSTEEKSRYARHFNLPNFGQEQQLRLQQSKVLVVGAGGLGSPLLLYLAAAGIGTIGIIDDDIVDLSNLQRQVLYTTEDIGKSKTTIAAAKIRSLNPHIHVITYEHRLDTSNALEIVKDYDIIADGTDNFPTRYLVNDACVILSKVNVYASIYQYEGQVSVFNYRYPDGKRGPHYRDLYPTPPQEGLVPDCATGGVLGVLAGIVGNFQALEVIKCLTKIGEPLVGRILLYDALSAQSRIIKYAKESQIEVKHLINYEDFCGLNNYSNPATMSIMKEISATELKAWRDSGKEHQLIDVRELKEVNFANIGGEHIVLGDILNRKEEVKKDIPVIVMCRSGQRSAAAINALKQSGYDNLINLNGGILAWARDVDSSIPTY